MKLKLFAVSGLMAGMIAVLPSSVSALPIISINDALKNVSFELGVVGACPTDWICQGSPVPGGAIYAPTSAQYTPGADGLPGSQVAPDGSIVAYAPTSISGSGSLKQSTAIAAYVPGNIYELTFWLGFPNTRPDGSATSSVFPLVRISWTLGGVNAGLCDGWGTAALTPVGGAAVVDNSDDCVIAITAVNDPDKGKWQQYKLSYTPTSQRNGLVGIQFSMDPNGTPSNGQEVNIDINSPASATTTSAVPEPATLSLLMLGAASAGVRRFRGRKRAAPQSSL